MRTLFTFIKEARAELLKVTWSTRDQVIKSTLLVIALTVFMALFLGGLDYAFGYALKVFILNS